MDMGIKASLQAAAECSGADAQQGLARIGTAKSSNAAKASAALDSVAHTRDSSTDENASPGSPKLSAQPAPSARELAAAKAARIRLGYEGASPSHFEEAAAPRLPDGPEPTALAHMDYIPLHECQPCRKPARAWQDARSALDSKNWVDAARALAVVQQLAAHHDHILRENLDDLMPVMVKHIRSLRSQLCKVAILCFGDVVTVVHDAALPHVERDAGAGLAAPAGSALCQLLLKSVSKEKMFVVAAAREVLRTCTRSLDPRAMLVRLVPYTQHKNPRVRGAVADEMVEVLQRLQCSMPRPDAEALDAPALLCALVPLLSDKTPEARASSRKALRMLKAWFGGERAVLQENERHNAPACVAGAAPQGCAGDTWQTLCSSALSTADALAVDKACT